MAQVKARNAPRPLVLPLTLSVAQHAMAVKKKGSGATRSATTNKSGSSTDALLAAKMASTNIRSQPTIAQLSSGEDDMSLGYSSLELQAMLENFELDGEQRSELASLNSKDSSSPPALRQPLPSWQLCARISCYAYKLCSVTGRRPSTRSTRTSATCHSRASSPTLTATRMQR